MASSWWRSGVAWSRGNPDVLWALAAAVLGVVGTTLAARHQHPPRSLDAAGYVLLLGGAAFLVVRRRWPIAVLAGTFAATFGYIWLGYPQGPIWLPLIVAFGGAVLMGKRLAAYASLAGGFVGATWLSSLFRGDEKAPGAGDLLGVAAWLLVMAAVTEVVRYRGELRRAAQREAVEARRIDLESARRRASEQRLTIARELHDVLAHSISMINVQAGVALELIDDRPEQVRASLVTIKQASKDALVEVQSVLGALRSDGERAETAPAPRIADLDRLVDGARAAGLRVDVHTEGRPRPLPAGTDLAAYRILQESLTNVVRHAGASAVKVAVSYGVDRLAVEVADDGRGEAPATRGSGSGNGIAGMRHRAEALGGELSAGRSFTGGFRVRATLPLAEDPAEEGA